MPISERDVELTQDGTNGSPKAGPMTTARSTSARNCAAQAAMTPPADRPATVTFLPNPWAMSTVSCVSAAMSSAVSLDCSVVSGSLSP